MDAQERSSAGDMGDMGSSGSENTGLAGMKDQATQKAAQIKNKVSDLGRKAGDKIDEQRVRAAGTFENTASALHERGDQFASSASTAAHATADKIQAAADYLREHDARAMAEDLGEVVKRYPGQALAAAAVVGFLAGRALRSSD